LRTPRTALVAAIILSLAAGCRSGDTVSPDYQRQLGRIEALGQPAADAWAQALAAHQRGERLDQAYLINLASANLAVQVALGQLSMDAGQRRHEPSDATRAAIKVAEAAVGRLVLKPPTPAPTSTPAPTPASGSGK
jgi:hypothetical protein